MWKLERLLFFVLGGYSKWKFGLGFKEGLVLVKVGLLC